MNIFDIDNLQKGSNGLYDFTKITFKYKYDQIAYFQYKVQKGEEMRIDLVCNSIYNNIDYIDILLNVNNISNPLNIKEGSIILYPDKSSIEFLRIDNNKSDNKDSKSLGNTNKETRTDSDRKKYIEENYSLPPTTLDKETDQVTVKGGTIELGNGLFNK